LLARHEAAGADFRLSAMPASAVATENATQAAISAATPEVRLKPNTLAPISLAPQTGDTPEQKENNI
jgi:hypothetical protein